LKILSKSLRGWLRLLKALSGQRVHIRPAHEAQAGSQQDLARHPV
jgi:hypothetical protein